MTDKAMQIVREELTDIMKEYRRQEDRGHVDSPGGLEHMGDVWRLMKRWDRLLQDGTP